MRALSAAYCVGVEGREIGYLCGKIKPPCGAWEVLIRGGRLNGVCYWMEEPYLCSAKSRDNVANSNNCDELRCGKETGVCECTYKKKGGGSKGKSLVVQQHMKKEQLERCRYFSFTYQ